MNTLLFSYESHEDILYLGSIYFNIYSLVYTSSKDGQYIITETGYILVKSAAYSLENAAYTPSKHRQYIMLKRVTIRFVWEMHGRYIHTQENNTYVLKS